MSGPRILRPYEALHGRERTEAIREYLEQKRAPLIKAALWAALHDRERLRPILQAQTSSPAKAPGIDWPELAPLTAQERTLLLRELRKIWQLPQDKRLRLASEDPAPKGDKPDLARPD